MRVPAGSAVLVVGAVAFQIAIPKQFTGWLDHVDDTVLSRENVRGYVPAPPDLTPRTRIPAGAALRIVGAVLEQVAVPQQLARRLHRIDDPGVAAGKNIGKLIPTGTNRTAGTRRPTGAPIRIVGAVAPGVLIPEQMSRLGDSVDAKCIDDYLPEIHVRLRKFSGDPSSMEYTPP